MQIFFLKKNFLQFFHWLIGWVVIGVFSIALHVYKKKHEQNSCICSTSERLRSLLFKEIYFISPLVLFFSLPVCFYVYFFFWINVSSLPKNVTFTLVNILPFNVFPFFIRFILNFATYLISLCVHVICIFKWMLCLISNSQWFSCMIFDLRIILFLYLFFFRFLYMFWCSIPIKNLL